MAKIHDLIDKVKKIPQMLLKRCEFDRTDYALNIVAAPAEEDEE